MGSTNATNVTKAKRARITVSAGVTSGDVVVINGSTLAFTGSTAGASSVLTFGNSTPGGASAGASAAGGRDLVSNKLASVINNSSYGLSSMLMAATVTTAALDIWVKDTAATSITIGGTAAGFIPSVISQQSIVEINAAKLDATSEYVAALVSTAATAMPISIITVRDGLRYGPPSTAAYHTRSYIKGT